LDDCIVIRFIGPAAAVSDTVSLHKISEHRKMNTYSATVAILQRRLTDYRVPLFEALRVALRASGIDLLLVHEQPTPAERVKMDVGHLPWAIAVSNHYLHVAGKDLVWQHLPVEVAHADLLILTQENSILSNYVHLLKRRLGGPRVAFWGHGLNFQSAAPAGLRERWKRLWLNQADWWFAYTELTVGHLLQADFPRERITCLNNALDTVGLKRDLAAVSEADLAGLREAHGIPAMAQVGLFCGSLYPDKRLDLLLDAARLVHQQRPEFVLAIIGDGLDGACLREQAAALPWVKILGHLRGREKAAWFRLADVLLNPGLVGLLVLDGFAAGLPMVTTATPHHGPEIAYLHGGENGLVAGDSPQTYADAVLSLLCDPKERQRLGANALAASSEYSVENMANHFAQGVSRCVASQQARTPE
jgi:glycosyltransferase involved in cell wall biosynthesis